MELSSIAKPYANAILAVANSDNNDGSVQSWLAVLKAAASIMSNRAILGLTRSPSISKKDKKSAMVSLINAALGQDINQSQARFIALLVDNARLEVLCAIYQLFEKTSTKNSQSKVFQIQTAFVLSDSDKQQLKDKLKGDGQGKIILDSQVNSSLMAGIIIKEEDKVIDNTLKAKLDSLGFALQVNT